MEANKTAHCPAFNHLAVMIKSDPIGEVVDVDPSLSKLWKQPGLRELDREQADFMSSPFFSVYAATKAALKIFIESVNVELAKSGSANRILNVSPGAIKGTGFYGGRTDLSLTSGPAREIISRMERKEDLFIPQYDEVFREVLRRYHEDFRAEGTRSYGYKLKSLRGR